jgi:hypothetical protein
VKALQEFFLAALLFLYAVRKAAKVKDFWQLCK